MKHRALFTVCLLVLSVCARPTFAQTPPVAVKTDQADKVDALGTAARQGDAAAVKKLLDEGVDVNSQFRYGATALSFAADHGHADVVKLLIERGAQNNGVVASCEVTTGKRIYQERLGQEGGSFTASPVAADGKLYFTSEDGDVFVVKAGPTYEPLATNAMGEVVLATPAISDGVIFVRGLRTLFAIAVAASSN